MGTETLELTELHMRCKFRAVPLELDTVRTTFDEYRMCPILIL